MTRILNPKHYEIGLRGAPEYCRTLHTVSFADLRRTSVSGQVTCDGLFIVIAKELVNLMVGCVTKSLEFRS